MSEDLKEYCSDTEVLSQSGTAALTWYESIRDGGRRVRKDFDWLGLANGASLRARITDDEESLAWASLSSSVFQRLKREHPDADHDLGEMYCRAATIEKHGPKSDGSLGDPEVLFSWFRESVSASSVEEVQSLIDRLMDELTDEFVNEVVTPLRRMKTRMTVIRALPADCPVPDDIAQLLRLYHHLP